MATHCRRKILVSVILWIITEFTTANKTAPMVFNQPPSAEVLKLTSEIFLNATPNRGSENLTKFVDSKFFGMPNQGEAHDSAARKINSMISSSNANDMNSQPFYETMKQVNASNYKNKYFSNVPDSHGKMKISDMFVEKQTLPKMYRDNQTNQKNHNLSDSFIFNNATVLRNENFNAQMVENSHISNVGKNDKELENKQTTNVELQNDENNETVKHIKETNWKKSGVFRVTSKTSADGERSNSDGLASIQFDTAGYLRTFANDSNIGGRQEGPKVPDTISPHILRQPQDLSHQSMASEQNPNTEQLSESIGLSKTNIMGKTPTAIINKSEKSSISSEINSNSSQVPSKSSSSHKAIKRDSTQLKDNAKFLQHNTPSPSEEITENLHHQNKEVTEIAQKTKLFTNENNTSEAETATTSNIQGTDLAFRNKNNIEFRKENITQKESTINIPEQETGAKENVSIITPVTPSNTTKHPETNNGFKKNESITQLSKQLSFKNPIQAKENNTNVTTNERGKQISYMSLAAKEMNIIKNATTNQPSNKNPTEKEMDTNNSTIAAQPFHVNPMSLDENATTYKSYYRKPAHKEMDNKTAEVPSQKEPVDEFGIKNYTHGPEVKGLFNRNSTGKETNINENMKTADIQPSYQNTDTNKEIPVIKNVSAITKQPSDGNSFSNKKYDDNINSTIITHVQSSNLNSGKD